MINTNYLPMDAVKGDIITLKTTNPGHLGGQAEQAIEKSSDFGQMLFESLQEVSTLQNEASDLSTQAIVNPGSIEAYDVTIAMAKANLSLSIVKNVVDRVIQGYKDIINLR
jgi:flagellar hook-basal body complex protein FliE